MAKKHYNFFKLTGVGKYSLPKERAILWIKALRSGQYKQGRKKYFNPINNSFCCMGIYYEINNVKFTDSGMSLLEEKNRIFSGELYTDLVYLNDVEERPFTSIADWIEENI